MSRYSGSLRTGAGTATLVMASLYAAATAAAKLKEVHVFNTTVTAVSLKLMRLNTAGTKPAAITDNEYDHSISPPALCTVHNTHTVAPTLGEEIKRVALGAAIGSGVIWTFGDNGILVPLGVANGVGLILSTGTGQICDAVFVWEE